MTGSPKKPKPTPNVTPFMNMYEVTKRDMMKRGMIRTAMRKW